MTRSYYSPVLHWHALSSHWRNDHTHTRACPFSIAPRPDRNEVLQACSNPRRAIASQWTTCLALLHVRRSSDGACLQPGQPNVQASQSPSSRLRHIKTCRTVCAVNSIQRQTSSAHSLALLLPTLYILFRPNVTDIMQLLLLSLSLVAGALALPVPQVGVSLSMLLPVHNSQSLTRSLSRPAPAMFSRTPEAAPTASSKAAPTTPSAAAATLSPAPQTQLVPWSSAHPKWNSIVSQTSPKLFPSVLSAVAHPRLKSKM